MPTTYGVTWGEGDGAGGSGDSISVNSTGLGDANLSDTLPIAPSDGVNVRFQADTAASPDDVSANVPTAVAAVVLSTIAGEGTAASVLRTNAQLAVFDGSNPATLTTAGAATPGSVAKSARRDHRHPLDIIDDAVPIETFSNTAANGTDNFLARTDHAHKSQTSGDWFAGATGKGLVTKDTQTTPRYWRLFTRDGVTVPATGGVTIEINSSGVMTVARDGGAAGDARIRIDDTGTVAP